MDILAVQQRFIDAGYQWQEHISNDGAFQNCSIYFTLCRSSFYFTDHHHGDFGFGRFERMDCWKRAAEWLDKVECGEADPILPQA